MILLRRLSEHDDHSAYRQVSRYQLLEVGIVHLNSSKAGLLGCLAAFLTRVPIRIFTVNGWAFSWYSGVASRLYLWGDRAIGLLATSVICVPTWLTVSPVHSFMKSR